MIATRTATLSRIGLVVVLLGSFTTAALAQGSVQLNVALSEGTRSVEVTNLAGAPLEDLTLVPGQASSYRVTVTDADYLTDEPFTVEAQNGNLYLVEAAGPPVDVDFDTHIDAADITLSTGLGTPSGLSVDIAPVLALTESVFADLAGCVTALTAVLSAPTDLLAATDACTAFLAAAADGDDPLGNLTVVGDLVTTLDLTTLADDLLGLVAGAGGTFDQPSFVGIGATDPAAAGADPATVREVLSSTPPTDLLGDLLAAVLAEIAFAGTESVTDVVDVADVLQALIDTGDSTAATLAGAIGDLTAPGQQALVDLLFAVGLDTPDMSWLQNLTGVYSTTPSLTVTPAPGLPAGSYAGTHTVTIVSS